MEYPNKMNLSAVKFTPYEIDKTPQDEDFSVPITKRIYGRAVEIEAQISFKIQDQLRATLTGDSQNAKGNLTMKFSDGVECGIKKGDRITEIAGETVVYEVFEVRRTAYLGTPATPRLIQIFFGDPIDQRSVKR